MNERARGSLRNLALPAVVLGTLFASAAREAAAQQPPPEPVLIAPGGPIYTPNPDYVWYQTLTATQYHIEVGDGLSILRQGTYSSGDLCSGGYCARNFDFNLPVGSYWWGVEAKNQWGGTWNEAGGFFSVLAPPAPTLTYPTSATGEANPTFAWNTVEHATSYRLQVGNGTTILRDGTYSTAEVCSGTSCAKNFTLSLAPGTYWWGAEARSAAGGSWATTNFTVQAAPPPVLTAPSGTLTTTLPVFTWNVSSGATDYFLRVSNGSTYPIQVTRPASVVCPGGVACALDPGQPLPVGSYTWWVQAISAAGTNWSAPMTFTIAGPPAPQLVAPSGTIATPTPIYQWNVSPGATQYLVHVSNGVTPSYYGPFTTAQVCPGGSSCALTSPASLAAGPYSWTVQAQSPAGGGPWAGGLNFTVSPSSLPPPLLLSPNGPMTAPSPTFSWTAPVGATEYFLEVKDAADVIKFQAPIAGSACSSGTCTSSPGATFAVGTYTWWVQAKPGPGPGGTWSEGKQFTVAGCGGQFSTGDFNGDGRTDRLCSGAGGTFISLSTATGFATATPWMTYAINKPLIGDYNSDGRADVAEYNPNSGMFSVALAQTSGTGFGALTTWGAAQTAQQGACAGAAAIGGTGDFDGNGYTDVSCKHPSFSNVFIGLSNGSTGFTFTVFGSATCATAERTGTMDMNGDGKDDWYCLGIDSGLLLAFKSTGTNFVTPGVTVSDGFCAYQNVILGDFNGDGKTDMSCQSNSRVRLSTGSTYLDIGGPTGSWCTAHANTYWPFAFGADVDGDGTAEMVCAGIGAAGANIHVRKWVGNTVGPLEVWKENFCFGEVRPGDFNGDGKLDILCDHNGVFASAGTPAVKTDVMRRAAGGLGGSVDVLYTPSTAFTNQPGFGPRMVATTVTTDDGRTETPTSTTTYTYGGGKTDRQERRSLGFQTNRTTLPCITGESSCPYVDTTFAQTLPSAGQPLEVRRHRGDNFLMAKQTNTYTETATIPRKSVLTRTDSFAYPDSGSPRQTYSTFAYDSNGNQTQILQAGDIGTTDDDLQTDFTFRPNTSAFILGKVAKVERRAPGGPALQTETFEYDRTGTYTNPAAWDNQPTKGDLTAVSRLLDRNGQYVTKRMTYSTKGDVLTTTDETNRTVTTVYWTAASDFLPRYIRNALNEQTELTWDERCQAILSTKDPNDRITNQTYDVLCRPSLTTDPATGTVQRHYQNLGTPSTQKTRTETKAATGVAGVDWIEESFDGLGRTYKSRKRGPASGKDIALDKTFNARSGLATTTAPYYTGETAYPTDYEYDQADRLVRTVLPDDNDITKSYTPWSVTTTDPNGKEVITRFDAFGRVTEVEKNGNVTSATHNRLGQQTGLEDAMGNTWSYTYDSLGRLWHENDSDAGHWEYDYDATGRPTSQKDNKLPPQQITMTYEVVGRIATKTSPVGTVTYTYSEDRGTSYFNKGRLTTVASPFDTLKLDYDNLGRTKRQQRVLDGTTYTVTKEWDAGGYLQSTLYPDNQTIGTLGYDAAGRLKSIPGILTNVTYDAAGRPLTIDNANLTFTERTYSPERGFLKTVRTDSSTDLVIQNLVYDHDDAGLVKSVTSNAPNEGWTYDYDDSYRLTSATNHTNSAYSQTWQYDDIGRIEFNSRAGVGTYTYPAVGQPHPHAPATVNGAAMTYDRNGNLESGAGRTLTWDGENRLRQATFGGNTTTFTYDAFGERLKKTQASNTSITPFGDDYEITNGTITKYISVEGLGVIAKKRGADTYWIHTDGLGSTSLETNFTGQIPPNILARTYRPYGETLTTSGTVTESRGWIDQRNDTETGGLTYLHARYFDPKLGQFLSPDPIGPAGGLNSFAYGFGDPVNKTDRSGLSPDGRAWWENLTWYVFGWLRGRDNRRNPPPFPCAVQTIRGCSSGHATPRNPPPPPSSPPPTEHGAPVTPDQIIFTVPGSAPEREPLSIVEMGIYAQYFLENAVNPPANEVEARERARRTFDGLQWIQANRDTIIDTAGLLAAMPGGGIRGTGRSGSVVPYNSDFALGQLVRSGNGRASELVIFGETQGWTRSQSPTSPISFTDRSGITRLTIKQGSARTPGSQFPHVELRNAAGERIDGFGNPTPRRSPRNHTPIIWDLLP